MRATKDSEGWNYGATNQPFEESNEWQAHIELLDKWTPNDIDARLRQIVQYIQSGPFYPADMHVQLIKKVVAARLPEEKDPNIFSSQWQINNAEGYNQCLKETKERLGIK